MVDKENLEETRQERRERKLINRREQVKKHGKNLGRLYKEAIAKRINKLRSKKVEGHKVIE